MIEYVLDSNIILYYLRGDTSVHTTVLENGRYLSVMSEIELLSYHKIKASERKMLNETISQFLVIDLNHDIKRTAIDIRSRYKMKTVDAIIASTALCLEVPLFTSDKDFGKIKELQLIIYDPAK